MSIADESGAPFKDELRQGHPKFGLFVNSASPTVAEQLSHLGYDWLLIDTQHGPMNPENMGAMLTAVHSGKAKTMVRVGGVHDRNGVQQALDLGADMILVPYINTPQEARDAVSMCLYPTQGTRSVYFPQRCTNKKGLLGYVGNANKNVLVALQVETASCIQHIDEIAATPGLDMLFLGQNDLCMSMGLFDGRYVFPQMYFSKELQDATQKLINAAKRNSKILGLFLFGTDRVGEFLEKGFTFISIGNDLHHVLTQANTHVDKLEDIAKGKWRRQEGGIAGESKIKGGTVGSDTSLKVLQDGIAKLQDSVQLLKSKL